MFITPLSIPVFKSGKQNLQMLNSQPTKTMGLSRDTVSFGMAKIPETFYKNANLLFGLENPEEVQSAVEGKSELEIQRLLLERNDDEYTPAAVAIMEGNFDVAKKLLSLADEETKQKLIPNCSLAIKIMDFYDQMANMDSVLDIADKDTKESLLNIDEYLLCAINDHDSKVAERIIDETDYYTFQRFLDTKDIFDLLRHIALLKPQTNKEDGKILNAILAKSGEKAKRNILSSAVEYNSMETAKFFMENIKDEEKQKILEESDALGTAVLRHNAEMTRFLLESAEKFGEETKQKFILNGAYDYVSSIEWVSPDALSAVFENADKDTSATIRNKMQISSFYEYGPRARTMLSSAVYLGRFDLVPIILQKDPEHLQPQEIETLGYTFPHLDEASFDKTLSETKIGDHIMELSETSHGSNLALFVNYLKKNRNEQLIADVLLKSEFVDKKLADEARRLATDSDAINIKDSIGLLEKYGTENDKMAVQYLKPLLAKEESEQ